jgi:hypothetical protein
MSYYINEKYRILNNKIDYLYSELKNEIFSLKDQNNQLMNGMNTRIQNIDQMNTTNIKTITSTRHVIKDLEYEIKVLRAEIATKDLVINNLRKLVNK